MEDPVFKGNQKYSFEMDLDEAGKRLYCGEANAGLAFQIGQLRYILIYTLLYQYKLVYTMPVLNIYKYILVFTSIYKYKLVYTCQ
jgi:hypothetical protein